MRGPQQPAAYGGPHLRHLAMPLGGVGAGHVAICGDGSRRQWQLHNIGNHRGYLPASFFAIRAASRTAPFFDEIRLLQGPLPDEDVNSSPLVTDGEVPEQQHALAKTFPPMSSSAFRAIYPFAEIDLLDDALGLSVSLEVFTPLIPHDVGRSSLPAVMTTFTLRNTGATSMGGWLVAAQQNAVGWDGITPIDGTRFPGYGGNINRLRRRGG